ncbi:TonB-dependent receptor [Azorhizobium oxalatiphilum]|uniref:TonB-dependent receptor n=2 Tax=Azorhizobium oxalatiphilum TaxID=980631 RepID=A0A917F7H7_9HYPH|nr:TonB-dependent receptor [Azorhizobium oxalatiphilum]
MAALMMSTSVAVIAGMASRPAAAQSASQIAFSVPAGPLDQALVQFGRQAGLQVTYLAPLAAGRLSSGISGTMSRDQALAQLLRGSGLSYSFTNARTVQISGPGASASAVVEGAMQLDIIDVSRGGMTATAPYETPAPVSHISQENIERFRGSSPADIFRGTPGVMSGESRNGGGGIDVNIRGMQGMGRVAVTVDGAENGISVYQGYQGASNRTFVDPDLLAGIDIKKGSDVASRGIAGTVTMRTVGADDVVKPGDSWGMRVKGGFGTNTAEPDAGAVGGYRWPSSPSAAPVATPSAEGMDRPGFFQPTSGSGSAIVAVKQEAYDLLFGYAYRAQGNYFAGTNGAGANPVNIGPQRICTVSGYCQNWPSYVENQGLTNYRAGEEVLNTQSRTESWLAKTTLRLENDQTIQLGYTGYVGEAGDLLASRFTGERGQPTQQKLTSGTKLDSVTARYRWNPVDDDLWNVTANLWLTNLEMRNPRRGGGVITPQAIGLGEDFRTGADSRMWGGDVANTSVFADGQWKLTLGASYISEDTRPSDYSDILEGWLNLRDAQRQEAATYTKVAYQPFDWLTLNAGLRYAHSWTEDRRTSANTDDYLSDDPNKDQGGFSPSVGVVVEPIDGLQFYTNYSSTLRFPSLVEGVSAFTLIVNENVEPERANNWEAGVNYKIDNVLAANDKAMFKFGYFNWDIENYIARHYTSFYDVAGGYTYTGMQIFNIDRARFSGLEFSGRYEWGGLTAELAANYYLDIEYCRTADTCENKSLYGDYATNHVPPEYAASLTLSQKLFDDALTVGGRLSYTGPRAIEHGDVTAQGAAQFIEQIKWNPYWLLDVFVEYKINDNWTASARVENVTDTYYVDPLGLVNQPGPGRTFYANLTGTFGGSEMVDVPRFPRFNKPAGTRNDWTGFYVGGHGGGAFADLVGTTTTSAGVPVPLENVDQQTKDLMFGGQFGFNYQFDNRFVVGLEASYSRTYMEGSRDILASEGTLGANGYLASTTHYEFDWMATLRGRLGYSFDRLFVYASGGLAFLHEEQTRDQYRSDSGDKWAPYGYATQPYFIESAKANRTGWTIGAGAEYALNDRWSVSADYAYARFGAKDFNFANARSGMTRDYTESVGTIIGYEPDVSDPSVLWPIYEYSNVQRAGTSGMVVGRKSSTGIDLSTLKIGLNYRF